MLREFCAIRAALEEPVFDRESRHIRGWFQVREAHVPSLEILQTGSCIERSTAEHGNSVSYVPDMVGQIIRFELIPPPGYFEDVEDLAAYTAEEPEEYHVYKIGDIKRADTPAHELIEAYRKMLQARRLLRSNADYEDPGKAVFLTPEKLEIPLRFSLSRIPNLPNLTELESHLEKRADASDPGDRDQRLVLFRKVLREYLKAHPPETRFHLFLQNFETIYDSYNRDYQLWIGNTFSELEKTFEEKRLKFISDLNGILAGVQASILAVPIAAILLADKYDINNPSKDFLLALGVGAVAIIAFWILRNQQATLDAIKAAIDATQMDFETKSSRRPREFQTRLKNLHDQENRVRGLLRFIRGAIYSITLLAFIGCLVALFRPELSSIF